MAVVTLGFVVLRGITDKGEGVFADTRLSFGLGTAVDMHARVDGVVRAVLERLLVAEVELALRGSEEGKFFCEGLLVLLTFEEAGVEASVGGEQSGVIVVRGVTDEETFGASRLSPKLESIVDVEVGVGVELDIDVGVRPETGLGMGADVETEVELEGDIVEMGVCVTPVGWVKSELETRVDVDTKIELVVDVAVRIDVGVGVDVEVRVEVDVVDVGVGVEVADGGEIFCGSLLLFPVAEVGMRVGVFTMEGVKGSPFCGCRLLLTVGVEETTLVELRSVRLVLLDERLVVVTVLRGIFFCENLALLSVVRVDGEVIAVDTE